jgi:hypothetical protein
VILFDDVEERPGGGHVAGFTEIDVDQIAVAVDCPVEIAPLPGDFEVGLVDVPAPAPAWLPNPGPPRG